MVCRGFVVRPQKCLIVFPPKNNPPHMCVRVMLCRNLVSALCARSSSFGSATYKTYNNNRQPNACIRIIILCFAIEFQEEKRQQKSRCRHHHDVELREWVNP